MYPYQLTITSDLEKTISWDAHEVITFLRHHGFAGNDYLTLYNHRTQNNSATVHLYDLWENILGNGLFPEADWSSALAKIPFQYLADAEYQSDLLDDVSDESCFLLHANLHAPVTGGDSFQPCRTYQLPHTSMGENYRELCSWKRSWYSVFLLYMQDFRIHGPGTNPEGIGGEDDTFDQMYFELSSPESTLSKQGLFLRECLAKDLEKPVYYYLLNDYSPNKSLCPSCQQPWRLNSPWHQAYPSRCDRCYLFSDR